MNIFVPQSLQTHVELEEIANVSRQLVLPKNSLPGIGVVQDGLIGCYNLTQDSAKVDWRTAMNLISSTKLNDLDNYERKEYSGRELYSHVLPEKVNVYNADDKFKITNGMFESGVLTNKHIGHSKNNTLTEFILDEYGMDAATRFLNNTIITANNYNMVHGMTVGIQDLYLPKEIQESIYQYIETRKLEVDMDITEMENNPDRLDPETFEASISDKTNYIWEKDVKPLVDANLKPDNNFLIMINSGSKGSTLNLIQMTGCVGLQTFESNRIPKNYNSRTLPYYFRNDDRAESRGFIQNSLSNGLTLPETIYQALVAREGLIDSACRTADSGYIQRKLIKSAEDFKVTYDGTVRNAVGKVEQFIYGDCGIDSMRQYEYSFKIVTMSDSDVMKNYVFNDKELKQVKNYNEKENNKFYEKLIKIRDIIRKSQMKARVIYDIINKKVNKFMIAVNIPRVINNIRNMSVKDKSVINDPNVIFEAIEEICKPENTMLYAMSSNDMKNKNSIKFKDNELSKTVFKYALYETLAPKRCMFEYKFTKEHLDTFVQEAINSFNKGVVEPGEMVGIIGAQSIGEPLSQMMLKSFHRAGVKGQGGEGLGVGRLREVFSLSENIKQPLTYVYFHEKYNNKNYVNKVASFIKYTTLEEIRTNINVYYDPEPYEKGGFIEQDNVYNVFKSYHQSRNSVANSIEGLNWLVRIEFDKDIMLNKEVTLLDIKTKICYEWEHRYDNSKSLKRDKKALLDKINQIAVASNDENDDVPIIHIRLDIKDVSVITFVDFMDIMIDNFRLKGFDDIKDIMYDESIEIDKTIVEEDGKLKNIKESQIIAEGINYDVLFSINGVDLTRTWFNDIKKTNELFGIEAARNLIINQLDGVMSTNKASINYQHISIFGDLITNTGLLTSIDRHGLNKLDTDPFSRASFEKPVEQLANAALYNEIDHMKSVSSRIMAGLCIKGGTGICDISMDLNMLENSEYTTSGDNKQFTKLDEVQTMVEKSTDVFIPSF